MKKLLLSTAILVASLTASAQNLIQHGDFTGVTTMTDAGALYRIAYPTDLGKKTQTVNPTLTLAETVSIGNWYKKASNSASLIANVMSDVTFGDALVSAVNLKKNGTGTANENQNQLLQYVALEENKTYKLEFDIKIDGASNAESFFVEVRTIATPNPIALSYSSNVSFADADLFTDLGNGWYRYSRTFKAANKDLTTEMFAKSYITISKDSKDLPYSYFIANVSLKEDATVGLGSANESNAKVYAAGKTVRVEGANGIVEVYNVAGQLVKQVVCNENVSFSMNTKGIFVVKVKEANASKTVKVIL